MLHQPLFLRQSLAVAVSLFTWQVAMAADEAPLASPAMSTMVITAPAMTDPYTVSTDARTPQLPLPAADGGAFLKSIPGFSVSRKGGTSGDPELRGLGGSRLNILADGANILGGCGGRMDPPTAYIFPQAYDRVEIIKGLRAYATGWPQREWCASSATSRC
ncbi:TonB-dependent receptor plug domain-containing protein [Halomonas sp. BC04]|uniref:TonB-dependent receptor plug domain-containing protein n=1 Tax=Halomonas sp. BC04 TaxID=1403540 RepID=UPI0003ED8602|nr:TonB-dependent receptor plug domain-containing protein [Halomonas sp. BC04]EWH00090.1 hypothetical protein Q427_21520 [Halomonas sp. BC04]